MLQPYWGSIGKITRELEGKFTRLKCSKFKNYQQKYSRTFENVNFDRMQGVSAVS